MEAGERIRQIFGARLRALREKAELSAEDLAKVLKTHRNTVYHLERGEHWVGADTLDKLCVALKVEPDRFFSDKEPNPTPIEALEVLAREIRKPKIATNDSLVQHSPAAPFIAALSTFDEDKLERTRRFFKGLGVDIPALESTDSAKKPKKA